jgi:hypothetical protein
MQVEPGVAVQPVPKIPWPQADFLCTMVLARRAFRLPSYRLPFVAPSAASSSPAATRFSSTPAARPAKKVLAGQKNAVVVGIR